MTSENLSSYLQSPNANTLPLHLKHAISIPPQTYKRFYKHISNSSFIQHFLLIICEITTHTPLKYRILHVNTLRKVYNLMSLYTFATPSTIQEMLLTDKVTASIPQIFHLFNYSYL